MQKLKGLSSAVLTSDLGLEMCSQYDELIAAMEAFEAALMADWCVLATVVSEQKLCQPVLRCGAAGGDRCGAVGSSQLPGGAWATSAPLAPV